MHQGSKFFSSDHNSDDVLLGHKAEITAVAGVQNVVAAEEIPIVFEGIFIQWYLPKEDLSAILAQALTSLIQYRSAPGPVIVSIDLNGVSFSRDWQRSEITYRPAKLFVHLHSPQHNSGLCQDRIRGF